MLSVWMNLHYFFSVLKNNLRNKFCDFYDICRYKKFSCSSLLETWNKRLFLIQWSSYFMLLLLLPIFLQQGVSTTFFSRLLFRPGEMVVYAAYLKTCLWGQLQKDLCDFSGTLSSESSSLWIISMSGQRMFVDSHGYRLPSRFSSPLPILVTRPF